MKTLKILLAVITVLPLSISVGFTEPRAGSVANSSPTCKLQSITISKTSITLDTACNLKINDVDCGTQASGYLLSPIVSASARSDSSKGINMCVINFQKDETGVGLCSFLIFDQKTKKLLPAPNRCFW